MTVRKTPRAFQWRKTDVALLTCENHAAAIGLSEEII